MKKRQYAKRILSIVLAAVMVISGLSDTGLTAHAAEHLTGRESGAISTIDDPHTLTRPTETYGDSTLNAGKILVGKSVTDGYKDNGSGEEPLDLSAEAWNMDDPSDAVWMPDEGNFLVTISQTSQMYGVSSKIPVPIDVVFVLDTSSSMGGSAGSGQTRLTAVVAAANSAINAVLSANKDNRVGVVAFSDTTSVLSELGTYPASSNHLQIQDGELHGQTGSRDSSSSGTNIHAGVVAGAQLLMDDKNNELQVTYGDRTVTRMPVLVVLSDGAPTRLTKGSNWKIIDERAGLYSSSSYYTGYGFLTILAASYYKNAITEKYFGEEASDDQRAFIYTIGVGLGSITKRNNKYSASDSSALENLTMNPSEWLGVALDGTERDKEFSDAWTKYQNKNDFTVKVNSNGEYSFKYHATNTSSQYNIDPSVTSLKYNDEYWLASSTDEINRAFSEVVIEIQKRAITAPTATDAVKGQNFSGYVNVTDPIGEYMEVKGINGVTSDGYLYQGKNLAQLAQKYDPNWKNMSGFSETERTFFAALENSLLDRLKFSNPEGDQDPTLEQVRQILNVVTMTEEEGSVVIDAGGGNTRTFDYENYGGQFYYDDNGTTTTADDTYGNSFTWFGNLHYLEDGVTADNAQYNDEYSIGFIGVAPKTADSVEDWLKETEADTSTEAGRLLAQAKAAGANVIVRSYFMYGGADSSRINEPAKMLHFQLRVITTLAEPHQQYVSIKVPASLLSMQSVLIDDTNPDELIAHYDDMIPTRVTYEVGLRSDITAENVWGIVSSEYTNEYGNVNADGTINFYAGDFNRYEDADDAAGHTGAVHDHAYANATFDVHDSNSFYRYEKDTQLLDAAGKPVTSLTTGNTYYYERVYYEWTASQADSHDGSHVAPAHERKILIPITMTEGWESTGKIIKNGDYWYVKEGTYTAFTLTSGDDQLKSENETVSAHIVSHPQRTNDAGDSNYTVWLGNNGRLAYLGVPSKTVYAYDGNNNLLAANIDGQLVAVGSKLNYQIQASNNQEEAVSVQIADTMPEGTVLAESSVIQHKVGTGSWTNTAQGAPSENAITYTYDAVNGKIQWNFPSVAVGETVYVRFDVTITEDAVRVGKVENEGQITVGQNSFTTNMTRNTIEGKRVVDANSQAISGAVTVGTILEYQIAYFNDTASVQEFTITDTIPAGTTYEDGSASHTPSQVTTEQSTGKVTALEWTLSEVQPGTGGVITFEVKVDASIAADAGETGLDVENQATIAYNNNPKVTNTTKTEVQTGALTLTKKVDPKPAGYDADQTFGLVLTESTGKLNGTYSNVVFVNGVANVELKDGETITISELPVGVIVTVTEPVPGAGYTAAITSDGRVTVVEGTTPVAVEVTNAYKAAEATLTIQGIKKFVNNDAYSQTKTFWFELQECDANGQPVGGTSSQSEDLLASATITAAGNGSESASFVFAQLTFAEVIEENAAKYYLLSEINDGLRGVTYDSDEYIIKITVADNGQGQLVPSVAYMPVGGSQFADLTITNNTVTVVAAGETDTFENSFAPVYTTLTMFGEKRLENKVMTDNQFSFEVRELSANNEIGAVKATGQSKADGSIVFTTITFNQAGTYTYVLKETTPGANITAGSEKYKIQVVVSDVFGVLQKVVTVSKWDGSNWNAMTGADALLEIKHTDLASGQTAPLQFTNIYDPGMAYIRFTGTKTLVGRDMKLNEFDFVVKDGNENVVAYGSNAAADNGDAGTISFDAIPIDLDDMANVSYNADGVKTKEFTYTITEVNGGDPKVTYSTQSFTVRATVTYNKHTGQWAVTYSADEAAFTNYYVPDPVTVTPVAEKVILSAGQIPADLTFGFVVIKAEESKTAEGETIQDGYSVGERVATGTSVRGDEDVIGTREVNGVTKNTVTSSVSFSSLTFYVPGTYTYQILETNKGQTSHGVEHSNAQYLMVVTVTQDESTGELSTDVKYYLSDEEATPSFENIYRAVGSLTIQAVKQVIGAFDSENPVIYDFVLEEVVEEGRIGGVHTGNNDANGVITFDTLTFTNENFTVGGTKTLTYEMYEVPGNVPGTKYDDTVYLVEVVIEHESEGVVTATSVTVKKDASESGTAVGILNGVASIDAAFGFKNTVYVGDDTEVTIQKTLHGRNMEEGEFAFVMKHVDTLRDGSSIYAANQKPSAVESVVYSPAADNGKAATATMNIYISGEEEMGQYIFEISEINDGLKGVTFDQSVYQVTVDVTDTDNNGQLEANVTSVKKIKDASGAAIAVADQVELKGSANEAPSFVNQYQAAPTQYDLAGTKVLYGRDMSADEFDFVIVDEEGQIVSTGSHVAAASEESAVIDFTPIPLNTAGSHTFTVKELPVTASGVTAGGQEYQVKIQVEDDEDEGVLKVTDVTYALASDGTFEVYGQGDGLKFENTYEPDEIVLTLEATKMVTGRAMREGEFTFYVYRISKNGVADATPVLVARGTNNAGAANTAVSFTFSDIVYESQTDAGTYVYRIVENDPDTISQGETREADGLTEDSRTFDVTVTVVYDNATGKLSIPDGGIEYPQGGVAFVNEYVPAPTTATIHTVKDLEHMALTDGMFTFTLTEKSRPEGAVAAAVDTKQNMADGMIAFDAITYTVAGDYVYEIAEDAQKFGTDSQANPNIVYDSTKHTVIVHVVDDERGALSATVEYADDTYPTFVNVNDPVDLPVMIEAEFELSKTVVDAATQQAYADQSVFEQFVFEVKDLQGNVVANGYNQADGSILFDYDLDGDVDVDDTGILYAAPGVYRYSISEKDVTGAAITKDPAVWWIDIEIEKDTMGGLFVKDHFVVEVVDGTADVQDPLAIAFTNTYDAQDITVQLNGFKNLIGDRTEVREGEFLFHLIDQADDSIAARGTTDAAGNIVMEALTYNQVGNHEYLLVEVPSTNDGVKYNIYNDQYDVVIQVTEALDDEQKYTGELTVSVTVAGENYDVAKTGADAQIQFTNRFNEPILIPIQGVVTKELTGRALVDGEFTFVINDENGLLVAIGKNDAQGNVIFDDIRLPEGEYKLYISEQNSGAANVTYDSTIYELIVTITPDATTGKLEVTLSEETIVFKNTYEKPEEPAPEPEEDDEDDHTPAPPASNPDTGDNAKMGLWISLMVVSLLVATGYMVWDKKKRKD